MVEKSTTLRFEGSVWCNLDIALRNVDNIFRRAVRPLGISVIEWYILRALYEKDGQHASTLAQAVGRAATSFTPNLDKLQEKGYIERRPDPGDRRAIYIHLTEYGLQQRETVATISNDVDTQMRAMFPQADFETFLDVVANLQVIDTDR